MGGLFKPKPTVLQVASPPPPTPTVTTPTPEPQPPAPMPDPESPVVREQARRDVLKRAGRASTILTAPSDRGRDSYSARTLGGGP